MKIGERLLNQLGKKHEPSTVDRFTFNCYDVALRTDEEGSIVLLFIAKADERGIIKGDLFPRRLVRNEAGVLLKDHWDYNDSKGSFWRTMHVRQ